MSFFESSEFQNVDRPKLGNDGENLFCKISKNAMKKRFENDIRSVKSSTSGLIRSNSRNSVVVLKKLSSKSTFLTKDGFAQLKYFDIFLVEV